jgi:hypothetical protein
MEGWDHWLTGIAAILWLVLLVFAALYLIYGHSW